jgi:hypothetical protein
LLKQHIAETRIGLVDPNRVHKFFYVMIHKSTDRACALELCRAQAQPAWSQSGEAADVPHSYWLCRID